MTKNVIIFISGNGSNMENIITYFKNNKAIRVKKVFTNKPDCLGVKKAEKLDVPVHTFTKEELINGGLIKNLLDFSPDLIVLAGFLLKVPKSLVQSFPNKIINIHPALLPKYGGKGMYGDRVHQAVIGNKETETGITIHYVNEHYDEGNIIEQFSVSLNPEETLESIKQKVHDLEMKHFPEVVEKLLNE